MMLTEKIYTCSSFLLRLDREVCSVTLTITFYSPNKIILNGICAIKTAKPT